MELLIFCCVFFYIIYHVSFEYFFALDEITHSIFLVVILSSMVLCHRHVSRCANGAYALPRIEYLYNFWIMKCKKYSSKGFSNSTTICYSLLYGLLYQFDKFMWIIHNSRVPLFASLPRNTLLLYQQSLSVRYNTNTTNTYLFIFHLGFTFFLFINSAFVESYDIELRKAYF